MWPRVSDLDPQSKYLVTWRQSHVAFQLSGCGTVGPHLYPPIARWEGGPLSLLPPPLAQREASPQALPAHG